MTKEFEDRGNTYTIRENVSNIGEVRVADEVVAIIAGLAATEIEGVKSMAGNITNAAAKANTPRRTGTFSPVRPSRCATPTTGDSPAVTDAGTSLPSAFRQTMLPA